jgi:hypothetical protein
MSLAQSAEKAELDWPLFTHVLSIAFHTSFPVPMFTLQRSTLEANYAEFRTMYEFFRNFIWVSSS